MANSSYRNDKRSNRWTKPLCKHSNFRILRTSALPMNDQLRIIHSSNPRKKFVDYVIQELSDFDNRHIANKKATNRVPVKLFLVDDNNRICGGFFAEMYWEAMQIFTLWVHEDYRGQGYGRALLKEAEQLARKSACKIMMVETTSFNGPEFYTKAGFSITGSLENFPEGHTFYYLNKRLNQPEQ